MSNTQQQLLETNLEFPEEIDTTDAKLVFLYLAIEEKATIDELQAVLGMKKISVYPLLQTLTATEHVERVGNTYVYQGQTAQTPTRGIA